MNKFLHSAGMVALLVAASAPAAVAAATVSSRGSLRRLQSPSGIDLTTCTPIDSPNFNIQLVNMGDPDATDERYVDAFSKAAERWQKVIMNDLVDFEAGTVDDWFAGVFSEPFNGAVDDVVIGFEIAEWDGLGGTLGRAGGVFVRPDGFPQPGTTVSGIMQFDQSDLDSMAVEDVKAIILHEMGHVLGLVGVNGPCAASCVPNGPTQGVYECPKATAEYEALAPGKSLFLENDGGLGTQCNHWEEDSFKLDESSELMTGFFEPNKFQPLSLVTVAALDEIGGYEVDYCGADIWPANETTQQRFEVFRTRNETSMGAMNGTIPEPMPGTNPPASSPTNPPFGSPSGIDLTTCTPIDSPEFTIELVNMGDPDATDERYVEAFETAAKRWQKVIVNDLMDFQAGAVDDWFAGVFSKPYNEAVDDVVIGFEIADKWDGLGGTLGRATPVGVRSDAGSHPGTTVSGIMQFDQPDLDRMAVEDVKAIILHEMGHVLGLVGVNGPCAASCVPNGPTQGVYECPKATAEYEALAPGKPLFLENDGGPGTQCGHWEEESFNLDGSSELMTGFFEANKFQPLSLVTVAALDDIGGYEVDYCGADIWPATETTQQRFEVFLSRNETSLGGMDNTKPEMSGPPTNPPTDNGEMSGPPTNPPTDNGDPSSDASSFKAGMTCILITGFIGLVMK